MSFESVLVVGHALVGRQDLPIPEWLFAWGASLVLIVSFIALTLAWHRSRFEDEDWRPAPTELSRPLVNPVTEVLKPCPRPDLREGRGTLNALPAATH